MVCGSRLLFISAKDTKVRHHVSRGGQVSAGSSRNTKGLFRGWRWTSDGMHVCVAVFALSTVWSIP